MKTFEVTTQVVVNTDIEFSDISDFRKYYRPDGNYTLRDIDPRFATRDGTIYHERLHQAQMDREIENAKPHIERSINRIVANSPEEAQRFANNILYGFQDQIHQNMHWPPAHQNIFRQEWIYYHQEYEKFLQRGGR